MYFKVMSQEEHKDDAALPAKCEEIGWPSWNSANGQDTYRPTISFENGIKDPHQGRNKWLPFV